MIVGEVSYLEDIGDRRGNLVLTEGLRYGIIESVNFSLSTL